MVGVNISIVVLFTFAVELYTCVIHGVRYGNEVVLFIRDASIFTLNNIKSALQKTRHAAFNEGFEAGVKYAEGFTVERYPKVDFLTDLK